METNIQDYFSNVADPRQTRKCSHLLSDILLIGLCTYLSNGEDYEDVVLFGQTKASLLPASFSLPHGVPSHDTFNRVFQLIEPKFLQQCLQDFGKDMVDILAEKQICIDGKKLKGGSPKSRANQGHYLLAVKGNQRELLDEITCAFKANPALSVQEDWNYGRGRIEHRKCSILAARTCMDTQIVDKWEGAYKLSSK